MFYSEWYANDIGEDLFIYFWWGVKLAEDSNPSDIDTTTKELFQGGGGGRKEMDTNQSLVVFLS